jgi:hypothetical protein
LAAHDVSLVVLKRGDTLVRLGSSVTCAHVRSPGESPGTFWDPRDSWDSSGSASRGFYIMIVISLDRSFVLNST